MDVTDVLLGGLGSSEAGKGTFEDKDFPPNERSLGAGVASRVHIKWRRIHDINRSPVVFRNVEPSDCRQGALGDCWLISSLAAIAEFPGVVNFMMQDKEITASGKYGVKIYSPEEKSYVTVEVDDYIPCSGSKPAFAASVGGEFWVPLIEKAYAKYVGSYEKLSGGWPALALESMTGSKSALYSFTKGGAGVRCLSFGDLTVKKAANLKGGASIRSNGDQHTLDEFWEKLKKFDGDKNLMTLASPGKDVYSESQGPKDDFGIVGGHAYTLISVAEVGGFRLCRIRNPWGDFEWGGDWSDRSNLWNQHPDVKQALQPTLDKDDGDFWMTYEEMCNIYTSVTVNFMNTDIASQPGPPQVDDNGNPSWIDELANPIEAVSSFIEGQIKEATGMDVEVDDYVKKCVACCSVM